MLRVSRNSGEDDSVETDEQSQRDDKTKLNTATYLKVNCLAYRRLRDRRERCKKMYRKSNWTMHSSL